MHRSNRHSAQRQSRQQLQLPWVLDWPALELLLVPSVLRCGEIHEAVHDTRIWMSSGNTSSSLHFDTHENLMLQVEGSKRIVFWPPSQSHLTYMDSHNRFGLSPVNPDRVDLDRFPLFASMRHGMVAHLHKGDALFTSAEAERGLEEVRQAFIQGGAAESFSAELYDGPHKFDLPMQASAFAFLDRWLRPAGPSGDELSRLRSALAEHGAAERTRLLRVRDELEARRAEVQAQLDLLS